MPHVDDRRVALASRALRAKTKLSQRQAVPVGRSRRLPLAIENGLAGGIRVDDLRTYFAQFGATVRVTVYWNGAALDRTIDERHAGLTEAAIREVRRCSFDTHSEVTFSEYGERGSVDVFGTEERARGVFVGEVKTEWGSLEETNRTLDVKARLAPKVFFDRFGWRPTCVAKVLIFPEEGAARRVAHRYRETLTSVYPARAREIRRWLRNPSGQLAGLWFLSDVTVG